MTARGRFVFDADTAQANAKINKLSQNTKGVGDGFVKATGSLGRMVSAAGIMGTISAAILGSWQEINQKMDEATGRLQSAAGARARALSLASNDSERERISSAIEATRKETGVDETKAANFQFSLESLGLAGNRADLAQQFNLGQDAEAVATAVSRLRKVFGEEAGNVTDLTNKLFAGAQTSEVGIDEFGETVARVGDIVKTSGTPLDDLIATFSQLGGKETRELATNVKALATASVKAGGTGGILQFVRDLDAKGLSNKQLQKELGSVEALGAFGLIRDQLPNIDKAKGSISDAVTNNVVAQRLESVRGDKRVASAQDLAQQQARTAVQEDETFAGTGSIKAQYEATRDQLRAQRQAQGNRGKVQRGLEYIFTPVADFFSSDADFAERLANAQELLLEEAKTTSQNTTKPPPRYRPENQAHPELPNGQQ